MLVSSEYYRFVLLSKVMESFLLCRTFFFCGAAEEAMLRSHLVDVYSSCEVHSHHIQLNGH